MAAVERIIKKASRRQTANLTIRGAGRGLGAGAGAGLAAMLLDRLAGVPVPTETYVILPAAGLVAGALYGLVRRQGALRTAVRRDRRLGLKDRLGTAEAIRAGRVDGDFAALVSQDADRVARALDVRPATPIRVTGVWMVGTLLTAALVLGIVFVPTVRWTRANPGETRRASLDQKQRAEIVETIDQAVAGLDDQTLDDQMREELESLARLADQLGDKNSAADVMAARDQSAAKLDDLADRLADEAQRNLRATDAVAQRFGDLQTPETPMTAEEFTKALQRGEFGAAADSLDRLLDEQQNEPAARRELADYLRRMSEQLQETPPPSSDQEKIKQLRDTLREFGGEESMRELLEDDQRLEEITRQALLDQDLDEETLRQVTQDVKDLLEELETQEQAEQEARRLAESLRKTAEQLDKPPASPEPPAPPPPEPETTEETPPQDKDADADKTQGEQRQGQEQPQGQQRQGQSQEQSQGEQDPARQTVERTGSEPQQGRPPKQAQDQRQSGAQTEQRQDQPLGTGERSQEIPRPVEQPGAGDQEQQTQGEQRRQPSPGEPPEEGPAQQMSERPDGPPGDRDLKALGRAMDGRRR